MKYGMKIAPAGAGWSITLTKQVNHSKYINVRRADGKGSLSAFSRTPDINLEHQLAALIARHEAEMAL